MRMSLFSIVGYCWFCGMDVTPAVQLHTIVHNKFKIRPPLTFLLHLELSKSPTLSQNLLKWLWFSGPTLRIFLSDGSNPRSVQLHPPIHWVVILPRHDSQLSQSGKPSDLMPNTGGDIIILSDHKLKIFRNIDLMVFWPIDNCRVILHAGISSGGEPGGTLC